jgi:biofilm PGA synthesis lipoprotein PgaB
VAGVFFQYTTTRDDSMPSLSRPPLRVFIKLMLGCWLFLLTAVGMCAAAPVKLTILSYHEIAERNDALVPTYTVTPANFAAQLQRLKGSGYRFVSIDDVLADASGKRLLPPKAALITFDDGYRSVYTQAFPILKAMKAPAVIALVGSWLEVKTGDVNFDGRSIPRSDLLSWSEIREMTKSGLVEVASHSHSLHGGIVSNPQGNLEPAATAHQWLAAQGRYEDEASYKRRVTADLRLNNQLLKSHLGRSPRIIVWPYGRYNVETSQIAATLGMPIGLTLDDGPNTASTPLHGLRRVLVEQSMSVADLEHEISLRDRSIVDDDRPGKVMHIDLDYIYDPDPVQQEKNLGLLLERIVAMGVNTVYLQAYSDPDGNGAADAVYFPQPALADAGRPVQPGRVADFHAHPGQARLRLDADARVATASQRCCRGRQGRDSAQYRQSSRDGLSALVAVFAAGAANDSRPVRRSRTLSHDRRHPLPRRCDPVRL